MTDEELSCKFAALRNLLENVLQNQMMMAKQISADKKLAAVLAENKLEDAKLSKMAKKAIRKVASSK